MRKYLEVFKISFQQEFVYRLNFIMWRLRNVLQILVVFFLWDTIFSDSSKVVFGYDRAKILTYIFGIMIVRSIVLSVRSIDIAGEISRGDISNYLIKPIDYLKYWFTRDVSSKALNLIFASFEVTLLFFILKPQFFLQTNIINLGFFVISLFFAVLLYFLLIFLFSLPTFWYPNQAWGFIFLLIVFTDILAGGVFPIDVLPEKLQSLVFLTPFPYLLFVPIEIYLGKYVIWTNLRFLLVSFCWILFLFVINKKVWWLGLKSYRAEGR